MVVVFDTAMVETTMNMKMKMKKPRGEKAANNNVSFATILFSNARKMLMVVVVAAAMAVDLVDSTTAMATATTATGLEEKQVVRSIHTHGGDRRRHGYNHSRRRNRKLMVNGFDTEPYEFSFHTQVGCCSGALIAPDVVLTASHDVPEDPTGITVTVNAYYTDNTELHLLEASSSSSPSSPAKGGDDDDGGDSTTPPIIGVERIISEFYRHPKSDNMHYDFTVLILDEPVNSRDDGYDQIRPIRINRSPDFPTKYQHVTLLGMGTTNLTGTDRPDVLQKATTSYIPNEECRQSFDPSRGISYGGSFLDDTSLCTHNITATSSRSSNSSNDETTTRDDDSGDGCVFDSGGPVIAKTAGTGRADDDDDDDSDEYLLVGLISFGVDCADSVYPAVNARVSAVSGWIDDVVCQHSRNPPSDFTCSANGKRKTVAPLWIIALSFVVVTLIVLFIVWKKKTTTATNTKGTGDLSLGERQSLLA